MGRGISCLVVSRCFSLLVFPCVCCVSDGRDVVIYHHGLSASGGHYTLDVLHPNRGGKSREGWVRIDDEVVVDVGGEEVFGAGERDDLRCAYLLFYRRVGR